MLRALREHAVDLGCVGVDTHACAKVRCFQDPCHSVRCPGCGRQVQRNGGCPHMTCRCGVEFCWWCGKDYKQIKNTYKHFRYLDFRHGCRGPRFIAARTAIVVGAPVVVGVVGAAAALAVATCPVWGAAFFVVKRRQRQRHQAFQRRQVELRAQRLARRQEAEARRLQLAELPGRAMTQSSIVDVSLALRTTDDTPGSRIIRSVPSLLQEATLGDDMVDDPEALGCDLASDLGDIDVLLQGDLDKLFQAATTPLPPPPLPSLSHLTVHLPPN
mmetsp:Transcript_11931/g.28085  ORF Transcript_11931/g.28085 Transcript_11931/m.28085 type:complete len:272 (-) Transcript_11931:40-855(-)